MIARAAVGLALSAAFASAAGEVHAACIVTIESIERLAASGQGWEPLSAAEAARAVMVRSGGKAVPASPGIAVDAPESARFEILPGHRISLAVRSAPGGPVVDGLKVNAPRSGRPAALDVSAFRGECGLVRGQDGTYRMNLQRAWMLRFPRMQLMNSGTKLTVVDLEEDGAPPAAFVVVDEGEVRALPEAPPGTARPKEVVAEPVVVRAGRALVAEGPAGSLPSLRPVDGAAPEVREIAAVVDASWTYSEVDPRALEPADPRSRYAAALLVAGSSGVASAGAVSRGAGGGLALALLGPGLGGGRDHRLGIAVGVRGSSADLEPDDPALPGGAVVDADAAVSLVWRWDVAERFSVLGAAGPALRAVSGDREREIALVASAEAWLAWRATDHVSIGAFARGLGARSRLGRAGGTGEAILLDAGLGLVWATE